MLSFERCLPVIQGGMPVTAVSLMSRTDRSVISRLYPFLLGCLETAAAVVVQNPDGKI